jgi:hypothetical protein
MTVLDPFPHAGSNTKKARCSITAIFHFPGESLARTHCVSFADFYGAKRWLELMIGNEECIRRGNELGLKTTGIKLRSFELDKILRYTYKNDAEATYQLPDSYIHMIARFRRGQWHEAEVESTTTTKKVEAKPKKAKKPGRPEGFVTITELCKGTAVQPMDARALLRASNLQ